MARSHRTVIDPLLDLVCLDGLPRVADPLVRVALDDSDDPLVADQ